MASNRILNRYKICEDYVIGYCTNGGEFIFDLEDYDKVKQYSWRRQGSTIYTNIVRNKPISLGRFVLQDKKIRNKVLFKNSNSYDCRKSNLYYENEFVDKGDYYEVYCFDGRFFLIDKEDYGLVSQFIWHIDKGGYVITKQGSKVFKLHRYIMGITDVAFPEVDHINRKREDNRRCNLRFSDRSGNCINKNLLPSNKSGKSGVYWSSSVNKWVAQINKDNTRYYLGCFDNLDDAIEARVSAEKIYHKEFASAV